MIESNTGTSQEYMYSTASYSNPSAVFSTSQSDYLLAQFNPRARLPLKYRIKNRLNQRIGNFLSNHGRLTKIAWRSLTFPQKHRKLTISVFVSSIVTLLIVPPLLGYVSSLSTTSIILLSIVGSTLSSNVLNPICDHYFKVPLSRKTPQLVEVINRETK